MMPRPGIQAPVVSRADKIVISALFASSLVRNNILVVTVVVRRETPSVKGVTRYDVLLRFAKPKLAPQTRCDDMCQIKEDRM